MNTYETYKESGIDWIGELPTHWNIKRLKEIANVETGNTPSTSNPNFYSDEGMPWIKPDNLNDFIELTDSAEKLSENGIKEARVVRKGAVLVCCIGTIGKIGIAGCDLATNQQINSVEFYNKRILDNYGKYLLYISEAELIKQSNRVVVSILNKIKQSQIKFPIPSIDEQLNIANYLDHQTQKIDRLIANKKAQAEKLKELRQIEINNAVTKGLNPNAEMKDSGIDWLGEIPKHWAVKRLKNILLEKMMYGANEIADEDDEQNPRYIRITDFGSNGELRDDTFKSLPFEIAKGYLLQEGDILFARSGATVGKTFQFRNYKGIACFAGYLIKARPNFNIITSDFLFFFTQSNGYENWKNSIFSKATIENIGADKYQLLKLSVPPTIDEQNKITEYLQKRTTTIDILIKNIDTQIEKLQELRKIKIYEAVTGKIKVHAYVEATA